MATLIRAVSNQRRLSIGEDYNFQRYLSKFQIEKFSFMFKCFFDTGSDGSISKDDIMDFLEKMRIFRDFPAADPRYLKMKDVLFAFYDCLMETVKNESQASDTNVGYESWSEALKPHAVDVKHISLNQWLNMWGKLCRGAAGISGFPFWVQLLAHIFFDAIDHDSDGKITLEEMKRFYKDMIGVQGEELEKISKEGYRALTANDGYVLDREQFLFCFANFLLGRDIYGPGKYIFGVFDNREMNETFKVKYNEGDSD